MAIAYKMWHFYFSDIFRTIENVVVYFEPKQLTRCGGSYQVCQGSWKYLAASFWEVCLFCVAHYCNLNLSYREKWVSCSGVQISSAAVVQRAGRSKIRQRARISIDLDTVSNVR